MKSKSTKAALDKIGFCVSAICALHCLAVPFILIFSIDRFLGCVDQEWIEWSIIAFAMVIGIISFTNSFFTHRQHLVPVLFIAGFLLLVNGESVAHTRISTGLSVAGALLICLRSFSKSKKETLCTC